MLIKKSQLLSSECDDQDYFDENSNLFSSNIEAINNEIITNKSRLKAVRNSLVNYEFSKKFKTQVRIIKFYKNCPKSWFHNFLLLMFIHCRQ